MKWDIYKVRSYCEERDLSVMEDEYINMNTQMNFKCKCGNTFTATFNKVVFRNKVKCNSCSGLKRMNENEVKDTLQKYQLTLLGKNPANKKEKITVRDMEGFKYRTSIDALQNSKRMIPVSVNNPFAIDNIKRYLSIENADVIVLSKNFNSYNKSKLELKCHCGNIYYVTWGDLKTRKQFNCQKCGLKKRSGKNHYDYNHTLTDEQRTKLRRTSTDKNMRKFREAVFKRDDYTCQACRNKSSSNNRITINAHHLNGFHWFEEGRFDIDNGITLCESCHKRFHKTYGRKNNNKQQFEEFLSNFERG